MYRALYRKWRPQVFSDVSGQNHITETLRNEISSGRLSHAYLFTGSRGTGKTTCAKILAKAVNCLNPQDGSPCNECSICRGIDDGSILDVTEIDAASNNSVDNIRDLRDEVNFTPAAAKYRVYIIDEVHMLSSGAFNALLKTLEEPPQHVLFILATTEVQKLPATILSRCQRFDFRRIPPEDIAQRLLTVAENENLQLDNDAALLIARVADGALRDALSILDQCAGYNEPITVKTVGNAAGLLGKDYLFEISDAILNGDSSAVLNIIDRLHSSSCDMERLMSELVNHFRNIMMAKTTKNPEKFIVSTPEELAKYKENGQKMTYGSLLHIMETLCKEASQLKYSSHQRAQTETTLIRLCSPALSTDNEAIVRRIDELEAQLMLIKAQGVTVASAPQQTPEATAPAVEKEAPTPVAVQQQSSDENNNEDEANEFQNPFKLPKEEVISNEEDFDDIPFDEPPMEKEYAIPTDTVDVDNTPLQEVEAPQPKPVEAVKEEPQKKQPVDTGIVLDTDNAVPFAAWENTLNQLAKINRPLGPMLMGSTAYRAGNTVFIKAKNTAFPLMFTQKAHADSIAEALMRATGEKLKPMIYNDGSSPTADDDAEPIDSFLSKLDKHNIDFIVEE
ncbi:MAG: DNA polymerase III subunit gamma/tau [Clostridia bacterium]|nr:DNA polymerase III subunit gamma/tau [Clostridia bacterium]